MSSSADGDLPTTATQAVAGQKRRKICDRCFRPEKICVCAALPSAHKLLEFHRCQVIVLQHPHEARRKNRSMPLVQLCVKDALDVESMSWGKKQQSSKRARRQKSEEDEEVVTSTNNEKKKDTDFSLRTIVHRRLGNEVDPALMAAINDPNRDIMLLFPGPDSMTPEEGLAEIDKRRKKRTEKMDANAYATSADGASRNKKIVVLLLDATWKYAKEMERANTVGKWWPSNIIRVQIPLCQGQSEEVEDTSLQSSIINELGDDKAIDSSKSKVPAGFKARRFDIRTPPSVTHLSTAECLAWIVSFIEDKPSIYETLMKPLDLMVEKWKSFSPSDGRGGCRNGFLEGDGSLTGEDDERQNKRREKKTTGRKNTCRDPKGKGETKCSE